MSNITNYLPERPVDVAVLRTSTPDKVAGWLLALVLLVGLGVGMLLLIFLGRTWGTTPPPGEVITENVAGRGDHAAGFARDLEAPGSEEVEELTEPSLAESLEAVTSAVTSVAASLDSVQTDSNVQGPGKGKGDSRPPGPLGEGDDIIPRSERWELKFTAKNLAGYASQLDYFKIEMAALGGGVTQVDYLSGLSGTPIRRSGPGDKETRLWFVWRKPGPLMQYDRQLLQKGQISSENRLPAKFIPKDLENTLAVTELKYAKETGNIETVKKIAKTIFESRTTSNGYEFVVIEQRYRVPKR